MEARAPAWALPLVPLVVGVVVMVLGGAPAARWGLHLGAGVMGLLAYAGAAAIPRRVVGKVAVPGAVVGIVLVASTLLVAGMEGVRRWHDLGPVKLHLSALLAPMLLVFAASRMRSRPLVAHAVLASLQVVHVLQPDAGQATAFGVAAMVCTVALGTGASRAVWTGLYGASIVGAWLRPDPLGPAPFVEDIVGRASVMSPLAGVLAAISLVALVAAPWALRRGEKRAERESWSIATLGAYLAASVIVPVFGEFPVPLLGFGLSPVLGAFAGLAALGRVLDSREA